MSLRGTINILTGRGKITRADGTEVQVDRDGFRKAFQKALEGQAEPAPETGRVRPVARMADSPTRSISKAILPHRVGSDTQTDREVCS